MGVAVLFTPLYQRRRNSAPILKAPGDLGGGRAELGQAEDGQVLVVQAAVLHDEPLHLLHHRQHPRLALIGPALLSEYEHWTKALLSAHEHWLKLVPSVVGSPGEAKERRALSRSSLRSFLPGEHRAVTGEPTAASAPRGPERTSDSQVHLLRVAVLPEISAQLEDRDRRSLRDLAEYGHGSLVAADKAEKKLQGGGSTESERRPGSPSRAAGVRTSGAMEASVRQPMGSRVTQPLKTHSEPSTLNFKESKSSKKMKKKMKKKKKKKKKTNETNL
ncbi:hypothetical protein EYF80_052828 [Liparis tanakae]|uniref:Uncharacterized protein n=1 Tax=Liparis tanakae TaxID=230148 RepID=A0A4Z2F782_9TELE|nr:hypothetical protein EYF80_052828 [Liparis tanakae]